MVAFALLITSTVGTHWSGRTVSQPAPGPHAGHAPTLGATERSDGTARAASISDGEHAAARAEDDPSAARGAPAGSSISVAISGLPNLGLLPLNVTFEAIVTGGSGTVDFAWAFGDGTPNASGNPVSHLYTTAGTFQVSVTANDSNGTSATGYFAVHAAFPVSAVLSSNSSSLSIGSTAVFRVAASGGFPPYSYSWSGLPPACSSRSNDTLSCAPGASGTYVVSVDVSDRYGYSAIASITIVVATGAPVIPWLWVSTAVVVGAVAAAAGVVWARRRSRSRHGSSARRSPPGSGGAPPPDPWQLPTDDPSSPEPPDLESR